MLPRVSVIVPVYNVAGHVAACLRSIAEQTLSRFEVIVIDDGSTDGSGEVARAAVAGDDRFEFVRQDNAGLSAARNAGLIRAQAPYIAFVDSDDRVAPSYLERLVTAIEESGADWVSCGIEFHAPGETPKAHAATHGEGWRLKPGDRPERHDFTDWCEVARHFPSAWNKLYRREILGDLRFDVGMLYEDHAFYWRYAARTDHLLRLPEPLYLSTQGRTGQITRDGSDNVFQQFAVLDLLEAISAEHPKTGREVALARIGTRLSFERAEVVADGDRWARFMAAARDWMETRGFAPDCALGVPPWWGEALAGAVPVSVVVPTDGQGAALRATLASLADQTCRAAEILVMPDETRMTPELREATYAAAGSVPGVTVRPGGRGVAGARNAGLEAARGGTVVFLDAGDTLPPRALELWHKRLRQAGAVMGFGPMRMGDAETLHAGLHDRAALEAERMASATGFVPVPGDALLIHGHPSAKIFDAEFLRREKIPFPEGALSSTHHLARICARICAGAARIVRIETPPVRIATTPTQRGLWRAPVPAQDLRDALAAMQADETLTLPEGWATRLWARLVWEKRNHGDYTDPAGFEADVGRLSEGLRQPGAAGLDPYVGARVRQMIGLRGGG